MSDGGPDAGDDSNFTSTVLQTSIPWRAPSKSTSLIDLNLAGLETVESLSPCMDTSRFVEPECVTAVRILRKTRSKSSRNVGRDAAMIPM